jgi:hypothetical protein
MATLTLNGLELAVGLDLGGEDTQIGESGRSDDGSYWSGVQRVKQKWSFRTVPIAKLEAEAWRAWLSTVSLHFPFDADFYSTDGLAIATNPTSLAEIVTDVKKYGAGSLLVSEGGAPTWATGVGSTWTVRAWRRESGTFYHYVVRSDGLYYKDGVSQGTGGMAGKIHIATGTLTLYGDAGDRWYDDVVVSPFLVPVTWITGSTGPWSYSGAAVYPSVPPLLVAAGDAFPAGNTSVGARVSRFSSLVAGTTQYQSLDVELMES